VVSNDLQASEGHATSHRRLHIGLQDHGVAHCQGGADRPRIQDEGRIPRCNNANDTDRNPPSDTLTSGFQVGGQDPLRLAAECRRFQELAGRHSAGFTPEIAPEEADGALSLLGLCGEATAGEGFVTLGQGLNYAHWDVCFYFG